MPYRVTKSAVPYCALLSLGLTSLWPLDRTEAAEHKDAMSNSEVLYGMSLEDLLKVKVSGATQQETELLQVPASINVFNKSFLALNKIDSLTELAPFANGFHAAYHDDDIYATLSTRGRRIGASGREILVLLDGMRIDNWYSGGATTSATDLGLMGIERVEFIRGAVSQVYGSGAYTGVINLISDVDARTSKLTLGDTDSVALQSNLGGELAGIKHKLFIDIRRDSGESYTVPKPLSGAPVSIDDGQQLASAQYQAHVGDWSVYSIFSRVKMDGYYSISTYSPEFTATDRRFYNLSLAHERRWNELWQTQVQGGYRYFNYYLDLELAPAGGLFARSSPASNAPFLLKSTGNSDSEWWLSWQNHINWPGGYNFLLGIEWRDLHKNPTQFTGNYDLAALSSRQFPIASSDSLSIPAITQAHATEQVLGVYMQGIIPLGERNEVTLGLRRDDYNRAGDNTAPRIAWVHSLDDVMSLKFIYGEAFRAPTSGELYLQNNPLVAGNPELAAELVKTREAIFFYQDSPLVGQIGYFHSNYQNPIGQLSAGGIRKFANLPDSRSAGFEANVGYQFTDSIFARINASHLTQKPDDQYRMPNNLLGLLINYQQGNWSLNLASNYVSERESNPPQSLTPRPLDEYWLLTIKYSYQINQNNSLLLTLGNVTDEDILEPSNGDNINQVPRRGRNFKIGFVTRL